MGLAKQYAFEQAIKAYLKRAGLSQAAVARKLHYTPAQLNKWIKGVNRIPDTVVLELANLLDLTEEERTELFTLAGYVAVNVLNKTNTPNADENASTNQSRVSSGNNPDIASINLRWFFVDALKDWSSSFFRWSEAPEHMRSSWAGLVLYGTSAITDRITPRGLLIFCLSVLLGIVTIQLVTPVLLWPLDDIESRLSAYLRYGLATLLIPLLVSFVTPQDQPGLFQLKTIKQRLIYWVLKFTGALVDFWVFSALTISLALILYYLRVPSLPVSIRAGFAIIPLFFSYVAARRIPIDRYEMFGGELRTHPADSVFLTVFILVCPLTAFFFFTFYWFFSDRSIAPVSILIVLTGMALWHYQQQKRRPTSDST